MAGFNEVHSVWRKVWFVTAYNFRLWKRNPRIIVFFCLAFILCFMLSDKTVTFAQANGTTTQIVEAFIWTFGDSSSIMLAALLMLLLYADMPFITTATPFYLMRISRQIFLLGQGLYIAISTTIYVVFILLSTTLVCMSNSYIANIWSETAAILGYSGMGKEIAIPAFLKVMELSRPYPCMLHIFLLLLCYSLLMALIMLLFNLLKGPAAGALAAFVFNLSGMLLSPELFMRMLNLPKQMETQAGLVASWLAPLNHATYYMHNFGYDRYPRLWQSYLLFGICIGAVFGLCLLAVRKYSFNFTGTEN